MWDIAIIYYSNKNWRNAISYFNRYIELCNSFAEAYYWRALCYSRIKNYENEIASYKKCLEVEPEYPAMNNLAYAYEKSKDYEQALYYYQLSIQSRKDGTYPYRNIFRMLKKLKRYDEAIEFWESNKSKFSKSFQNDVDKMREAKNNTQQQILPDDVEDENETLSEPPNPIKELKSSKKQNNKFSAESRLEDEIEDNINKGFGYFNLPLKMYDNDNGYGRQYIIPAIGRIDILAVNTTNNDLYVIELKRGFGDDEIVGQISRYMGWVKKNLASDGQNGLGIICVAQASDKLKYAAEANPNISIYNYSIQITPV